MSGKRYRFAWRGVSLEIRHQGNYLADKQDHLEVCVLAPKGAPLPITETGYRSHFLSAEELAAGGGPRAYVVAWLDREANSSAWAKTEAAWRQLSLDLVVPPHRLTRRPGKATAPRRRPRQATP